ncbi:MAG: sucrase ferredoxin [Nocardioides sp.]|jgi:hypothetical protein|nr:sucrase ferredoxin [Nocardioides sp.]
MTSRDPAFRCAGASVLRDEPVTGTASTVRAFLLVENTGPWGVEALRDARLPDGLGRSVTSACAAARVRPLLVRRPDRQTNQDGIRVFVAYAHPERPWLESGVLADPHELLGLDLAALGAGRSAGLQPDPTSLLCVCTHGRHDACCAERGRPVSSALALAHPEETWEVSHIGGDRFAGNLLVLPHGLYYGRLDPASALAAAGSHAGGELDLDHLRGRSGFPMPVQYAEIALRRELAETRDDALRLVSRSARDGVTEAVFDVAGATWEVRVRASPGQQPEQLTCKATRDNPIPVHELLDIVRR